MVCVVFVVYYFDYCYFVEGGVVVVVVDFFEYCI